MITREQYTKQQSIISSMMTICDEDRAKAFIGKRCYFANDSQELVDIAFCGDDGVYTGILSEVDNRAVACPYISDDGENFLFVLPCDFM